MEESAIHAFISDFKKKKSPNVLTVYLGFPEKKSPSKFQLITQFHNLLRKIDKKKQKEFRSEIKEAETYIEDVLDTRGKRSFLFALGNKKILGVFSFEFYIFPSLKTGDFYSDPFYRKLDEYKKYMVILIDREKARLFTVYLGKITEHKEVFNGIVPQRVREINKAWMRQDKISRHIEDHLGRHLKIIAEAVEEFAKNKKISFIILGGHKELIPKMKKYLSKKLQSIIWGEFVTELNIPLNDTLLKSKNAVEDLGTKRELERLEVRLS